jgi:methyl-accepting chemotaxis protein
MDINKLQDHSKELSDFFTHYEAGLYVDGTNYKIRWCGTTTTTSGPISFTTSMPEGTVLRIMASPKENQIASARRSAEMVIESLRGVKLAGAVIFDCVVRGVILQDEFHQATDAIKEVLKVPFVGLETYGEFAMEIGQMSGFHNTTTVILAIPD